MDHEGHYWSVRDAGWRPAPRPVDALETPWSLHARTCSRWQPTPTAEADLRWLRRRPAGVPAQRQPVSRPQRTRT